MRTEPTPAERDWLLDRARAMLDHATGAHKCECAKDKSPAEGFGVTFDSDCGRCFRGYVSNPGWDGTREHFDALLPHIKSGQGGGTACLVPGTHPRDWEGEGSQ